jgi:tRNA pseudouridine55 synthase
MEINGILVVDKPLGWTSHDVVKKTRNLLGGIKVGHTGTLDPDATGVLVLLIGRATKYARYFSDDKKRYCAEILFGRSTDTYDSEGKTTATGDTERVNLESLEEVIKSFIGDSEQIPPMYSAVKVEGKKLYQLARKGTTIERKPRKITIYSIGSDSTHYPRVVLDIVCSKGTYIRTVAHQLGEKVGCPSHLSALRRTASGEYTLKDAADFLSIAKSSDLDTLLKMIRPVPRFIENHDTTSRFSKHSP